MCQILVLSSWSNSCFIIQLRRKKIQAKNNNSLLSLFSQTVTEFIINRKKKKNVLGLLCISIDIKFLVRVNFILYFFREKQLKVVNWMENVMLIPFVNIWLFYLYLIFKNINHLFKTKIDSFSLVLCILYITKQLSLLTLDWERIREFQLRYWPFLSQLTLRRKDFFLMVHYLPICLVVPEGPTDFKSQFFFFFLLKTEKFNWFITYLVVENREGTYVKTMHYIKTIT